MRSMSLNTKALRRVSAICSVSIFLSLGAASIFAQAPMAPMAPMGQSAGTSSADQNKQLADQVTELRAQVARLQSAVQQNGSGSKTSAKSGMKMSPAQAKGMGMMGEMGMAPKPGMAMKDDQGEMGAMQAGGSAPMPMGDDKDEMGGMAMGGKNSASAAPAMGMCCGGSGANTPTGGMSAGSGGMAAMNGSSSAMPGQAGASHLYHIGSNGFFLNHSQHITLTGDQRQTLNHLKEKAMLDRSYEQRRIDQGEQELYSLTGADQPDNGKIQAKVAEIEKMRAGDRMNFIRSVEEASNVLTPEQRKALLGTMPANRK